MTSKMYGKPVRLDDRLFNLSDDLVILCLPEWFRTMLLSLAHDRPFWGKKVWGRELTESEVTRLEYGLWALSVEECDMVINVSQSQTQTASGGAGGAGGSTTIPIYTGGAGDCACLPMAPPGSETPPPVVITEGVPPPGWEDYPTYNAARCAIANYGWQLAYEWITALSNVQESALALAAFIFFLLNTAPAIVFALFGAGAIAALLTFLGQLAAYAAIFDDFFEDLKAYWVNNRQELICQGYNAQSEIPLFQTIMTALSGHMQAIWADREYDETVIYILSKVLEYALPSSVMGLFLNNESEDFFGTYQPPLSCSGCSELPPPMPGDAWQMSYGISSEPDHTYGQNEEVDHNVTVAISGAGAGGSLQQGFDELVQFSDVVDPEDFDFTAVTFTLSMTIAAPVGNAAIRQVRFGQANEYTLLQEVTNGNGQAVSFDPGQLTYGLRLASHQELGTDVEVVVTSKAYLRPQFILDAVGYGLTRTTWDIQASDFTMLP